MTFAPTDSQYCEFTVAFGDFFMLPIVPALSFILSGGICCQ